MESVVSGYGDFRLVDMERKWILPEQGTFSHFRYSISPQCILVHTFFRITTSRLRLGGDGPALGGNSIYFNQFLENQSHRRNDSNPLSAMGKFCGLFKLFDLDA